MRRIYALLLLLLTAGCTSADFTMDRDEGGAPLTVQFSDQSFTRIPLLGNANALVPIRTWAWDFGDGALSTIQNPEHEYLNEGTYTVKLTITTARNTDTVTKEDAIRVTGAATGPTASFTAAPLIGVKPLAVKFTDTSTPGSAGITAWAWDFGNGKTSDTRNPTHTYDISGTYTVTLEVTTNVGSSTIVQTKLITVTDAPLAPRADFREDKSRGAAPLTVQFTDVSDPGTGTITQWRWNFGDSGASSLQSPSHAYTAAGTYDVSLEVTSSLGTSTRLKNDLIVVTAAP